LPKDVEAHYSDDDNANALVARTDLDRLEAEKEKYRDERCVPGY
jgi:hypothetical protein